MNRRSFFGYLGRAAGVSLAMPSIIAAARPGINPAWVTAEYQIDFQFTNRQLFDGKCWETLIMCEPWPASMGNTIDR